MPISKAAARGITDEFARRRGPKTGLVLGAAWGNPVLTAAMEALMPSDHLTVVCDRTSIEDLRSALEAEGSWTAGNVTAVADLAEAEAVEEVMLAEPVTVEAEAFIADIETLREKVLPGGVLSFAATLTAPAREEIAELVADYGIGTDLIVRSFPPLRIHKLRIGSASEHDGQARAIAPATDLAPAWRASSVALTPGVHVDSNGIIAGGLLLGTALAAKKIRPKSKAWMLPAAAALPVAAFFRDPVRQSDLRVEDDEPEAVLAASDGRIMAVETVVDERFGAATGTAGSEWLRISVYLSLWDVHINRSPVAGEVADVFTERGGYAKVSAPEAEHNAACYTVLNTPRGRVVVAQRTGAVLRRIVNRTKVGAALAKGERYGLIRFGSRTDIYLPAGAADASIAPGEPVRAGETVIARWR
ncbi:phosphatidylserine decarboxylase [Glycomyces buryatensis]|uniref:Phosphatidylserine decarboxylase family protein n=1 Tax=Glycomyces buryatensis TaxID=2570927 RepID=A0A4S8QF38_9ACTN|nr:phosphatidylserine decarboxylase [Glycomyces buryatensis]THV42291.1 phosphatidylserine decarboxylase family protein [Glycomyces buryatensis]